MIRSFFVPFHFQLLFSFASHLNCMVSSFEFLLGQFVICLDSIVSTHCMALVYPISQLYLCTELKILFLWTLLIVF